MNKYYPDFFFFVSLVVIVVFLVGNSTDAFATNEHIGIVLSNTCLVNHINLLPTTCPTYTQLMLQYGDDSNRLWSGGFTDDNNYYHRENKALMNHYLIYDKSERMVWIDPPADTYNRMSIITIYPSLDKYPIKPYIALTDNITKTINIEYGAERFVDDSCRHAKVSSKNYSYLIDDTMTYLRGSCNMDNTTFTDTLNYTQNLVNHDITESHKYRYAEWVQSIILSCLSGNCQIESMY